MLPSGFFPENHNRHLAVPTYVFYFKKLPDAANQLRVIPRDLAFLRVAGVPNMPLLGSSFLVRKTSVYDSLKIYVRTTIRVLIIVVMSSFSQRGWLEPRRTALQRLLLKSSLAELHLQGGL